MIDRREFLKRLGFVAAAAAIAPSLLASRAASSGWYLSSGSALSVNGEAALAAERVARKHYVLFAADETWYSSRPNDPMSPSLR